MFGETESMELSVTESQTFGDPTCSIWDRRNGAYRSVERLNPDEARLLIAALEEYLRSLEAGELPSPQKRLW